MNNISKSHYCLVRDISVNHLQLGVNAGVHVAVALRGVLSSGPHGLQEELLLLGHTLRQLSKALRILAVKGPPCQATTRTHAGYLRLA